MAKHVTKEYLDKTLDQRIDQKVSHQWGIIKKDLDGKFQLLIEGQQMIIERLDRFESETRQNFGKLGTY